MKLSKEARQERLDRFIAAAFSGLVAAGESGSGIYKRAIGLGKRLHRELEELESSE